MAALASYDILDSGSDPAFDALVCLAATICEAPMAQINFIDATRQYSKAQVGIEAGDVPRENALCNLTLSATDLLEIGDTLLDERCSENPFVVGDPRIRFYAGMPLVDDGGHAIGSVCVVGKEPRSLTTGQRDAMRHLGASLVTMLKRRRSGDASSLDRLALVSAGLERAGEPVAILHVGANAKPVAAYVNRAFTELFGYEPGDIVGRSPDIIFGPATDRDAIGRLLAAVAAGEPMCQTVRLYRRDGDERLVEIRDRPIDEHYRIATYRDLTSINATQEALAMTAERLDALLSSNTDIIFTLDTHGTCVDVNEAGIRALGFSRAELLGDGHRAISGGAPLPGGATPEQLSRGDAVEYAARYRHRDGRGVVLECKAISIRVSDRADGYYIVCRDVTERMRLEALVAEQAGRTHALCTIASKTGTDAQQIDAVLALVLLRLDMQYAYVGKIDGPLLRITNVAGSAGPLAVDMTLEIARTHVSRALETGDVHTVEDVARASGSGTPTYPGWRTYIAAPLLVDGRTYGAIGFLASRDVEFNDFDRDFIRLVATLVSSAIERQEKNVRLDRLAFYDTLTGLSNRAKFMLDLDAAINLGKRRTRPFALHYIDLDGFKSVNDGFGHPVGDLALVETARRLGEACRTHDIAARLGGDEFVILQTGIDHPEDAVAFGERIVDALSIPYDTPRASFQLGASVGIATFPGDGLDARTLLHVADVALYRAKALGKRRVAIGPLPEPLAESEPLDDAVPV